MKQNIVKIKHTDENMTPVMFNIFAELPDDCENIIQFEKYELVFDYTKYYDLMFNSKTEIKNTLMIGGAGYGYPKYFISHFENLNMDVVEIDGQITEIAKEYFYLNDLINEYNLNENKRLKIITEDGRTYLNKNIKKYDAILNSKKINLII